jgi:hypothetical protein
LVFLATGPERKIHAYDRDNGKELWQHSLPNGAEGMMATYQVNGRQFVVLPVRASGPVHSPLRSTTRVLHEPQGRAGPPEAGAAQAGAPGGAGGRQGRGGGPTCAGAYIAFALPQ